MACRTFLTLALFFAATVVLASVLDPKKKSTVTEEKAIPNDVRKKDDGYVYTEEWDFPVSSPEGFEITANDRGCSPLGELCSVHLPGVAGVALWHIPCCEGRPCARRSPWWKFLDIAKICV